jgi:hypothetical protein
MECVSAKPSQNGMMKIKGEEEVRIIDNQIDYLFVITNISETWEFSRREAPS